MLHLFPIELIYEKQTNPDTLVPHSVNTGKYWSEKVLVSSLLCFTPESRTVQTTTWVLDSARIIRESLSVLKLLHPETRIQKSTEGLQVSGLPLRLDIPV